MPQIYTLNIDQIDLNLHIIKGASTQHATTILEYCHYYTSINCIRVFSLMMKQLTLQSTTSESKRLIFRLGLVRDYFWRFKMILKSQKLILVFDKVF